MMRFYCAWGIPTAALFAYAYQPTLVWLYERFMAPDTYYSHGFLVPLVTLVMVWRRRFDLAQSLPASDLRGLILVCCSLVLHILATYANIYFLSGLSIPLFALGICLYAFGRVITRHVRFALLFLFFMIPLPTSVINTVSIPLKIFVTKAVVFILGPIMGIPLRHEGFKIFFAKGSLTVENPCSGLRSLIVIIALGTVFAYLLKGETWKRALVALSSIPIALASNILRVLILCLSVHVYGPQTTQNYVHDSSGYVMFAAAFSGLWLIWNSLQ
jgi:exosortase